MNGYVLDRARRARVKVASVHDTSNEGATASCWCNWGETESSLDRAKVAVEDHLRADEAAGGHNDKRAIWWV